MTNYSLLTRALDAAFPDLPRQENEPLAHHCSFRIGGPVPLMLLPRSAEELAAVCRFLRDRDARPFLLGNGTNLLFPDGGLDRVVVKTCQNVGAVSVTENTVAAECGATLARAASAAMSAGLAGLEFAHGIPGSVGGGVVMNAGAYGGELKDVITETEYLDEELETRVLRGEEHGFSYRHSLFSDRDCVVLRTVFSLTPGDPDAIRARMGELMDRRRASQPLDMPSAGSAFKRPAGGYAAALIDQAGLKGFSVGGAQVSPKHAGFVVNTGSASCDDVLRLLEHIQTVVFRASGIRLEPEIRIVRG